MSDERFSFANRSHLSLLVAIMVHMGALCDACGTGTRATSKRWAKCLKCGKRIERKDPNQLSAGGT